MYDVFLNVALSAGMQKCSFCSIYAKTGHYFMEINYLCQQKEQIMNKQPQLMDVTRMRDILTPHLSQIREYVYMNSELAMVRGDHTVFSEAEININLQDRHLKSGTLVYIGPGTIIHPKHLSADLRIFGMGLFSNFPMPFAQGQMPSAFNGQVRDFQLPVSEADIATAQHILDTIWQMVHAANDYHRPTITALVAALMHHYDQLFHQQANQLTNSRSREQTIFDRFLQLVTQHCAEQHQIGYYAERMCLTERYLTTVIRQTSGTTAKDWIDRALITRIKIELRHTDKSSAQIAEEMHFANPSFFSKYFRRLTGMTPGEYKNYD